MLVQVKMPPQLFVGRKLLDNDSLEVSSKNMQPIKNAQWSKPSGGLWTSTYDPTCGSDWVQWNLREGPARVLGEDADKHWEETSEIPWDFRKLYFHAYVLYPKLASIFVIDSIEDLIYLRQNYSENKEVGRLKLDFEKMSQDFDALHLTQNGQWETRFGDPNIYGWDVESTIWFRWVFEKEGDYLGKVAYQQCNMALTEKVKRGILGLQRNPRLCQECYQQPAVIGNLCQECDDLFKMLSENYEVEYPESSYSYDYRRNPEDIQILHYIAEIGVIVTYYPGISLLTYALSKDLTVQDVIYLINYYIKHGKDPKTNYWVTKIFNKKQTHREMDKLLYLSKLYRNLPEEDQIIDWKTGIIFEPSELELYGFNFNKKDWMDILEDLLIRVTTRLNQPLTYDDVFGDKETFLRKQVDKIISDEIKILGPIYGIYPDAIGIKLEFLGPEIFQKFNGEIRPPEKEVPASMEKENIEEIEEEDIELPDEVKEGVESPDEVKEDTELPDKVKPTFKWVPPVKTPKETEKESEAVRHRILVLGGTLANLPSWIRDNFEVYHIEEGSTISPKEADRFLTSWRPEAIIMRKFLSHNLSLAFQRTARQYKIPYLIAKPSMSNAIQQAERDKVTWFTQIWKTKKKTKE